MNFRFASAAVALTLISTGCAVARAPTVLPAKETEALFHQDARWLGGDAAYSIPVDGDRVLWLFGDSFIALDESRQRTRSRMVHNSVAIQHGRNPRTARMEFLWKGAPAEPTSFYEGTDQIWLWPLHGAQLGASLVQFFTRVQRDPTDALGFKAIGWQILIATNIQASPEQWQLREVASPETPTGLVVGTAVVKQGEHLVALAIREPGDHAGFLVRWALAAADAADFSKPEWWTVDGWRTWSPTGPLLKPVFADAGPECSLHFDATRSVWTHIRSAGFGATDVVASTAPALEGPWSEPSKLFRPPESGLPGLIVYAAKAHPELEVPGVVLTYSTNSLDFKRLVEDPKIYFPRAVTVPSSTTGQSEMTLTPK